MLGLRVRDKRLEREWLILLPLLGAVFYPVFTWMYERWTAQDSFSSHGFLVPIVSGLIIYSQREQLRNEPRRPSPWGLVLLSLGLIVFILSGLLRVYFTSGFALLIILA